MKNKYIDLIEQSFEFPQDEFKVEDGELMFHNIPVMDLIEQYGTPLKITYLPKAFCDGVSCTLDKGSSDGAAGSSSCFFKNEKPQTNRPMPSSRNTMLANDHI